MSTQSFPLQAHLHLGNKTVILANPQDLNTLPIKLIVSSENSPAWTCSDSVDQAQHIVFEMRKMG